MKADRGTSIQHRPRDPATAAPDHSPPGQINPFDTNDRNLWVKLEHLGRYLFAADYLEPLRPEAVADIACGVGYGLPELARGASSVFGVDNDKEVLDYAAAQFRPPNTQLIQTSIESEYLVDHLGEASLHAIVSFETLEHLVDPARALRQFCRLLTPGGILICSVPNRHFESRGVAGVPANPTHRQLFSFSSLCDLLREYGFEVEYRLGQSLANRLLRRETELVRSKVLSRRIRDIAPLHEPDTARELAYLFAYPSVEDAEGSYAMIVVAKRVEDTCDDA